MTPPGSGGGTEDLDVSVVLPVLNEQGHLQAEIDRIRDAMDASRFSYEIIVIDDGSTDGSGDALRAIEGIRLIQFGTNRGSGSARKYGTQAARGRIVVWTDRPAIRGTLAIVRSPKRRIELGRPASRSS